MSVADFVALEAKLLAVLEAWNSKASRPSLQIPAWRGSLAEKGLLNRLALTEAAITKDPGDVKDSQLRLSARAHSSPVRRAKQSAGVPERTPPQASAALASVRQHSLVPAAVQPAQPAVDGVNALGRASTAPLLIGAIAQPDAKPSGGAVSVPSTQGPAELPPTEQAVAPQAHHQLQPHASQAASSSDPFSASGSAALQLQHEYEIAARPQMLPTIEGPDLTEDPFAGTFPTSLITAEVADTQMEDEWEEFQAPETEEPPSVRPDFENVVRGTLEDFIDPELTLPDLSFMLATEIQ